MTCLRPAVIRCAALLAAVALAPLPLNGQTWVYDLTEGGWKDVQTGLVWFQHQDPMAGDFDEAQYYAANLELLGFNDWRLPSVAEMQTAREHEIGDYVTPLAGDAWDPPPRTLWWSSRATGKNKAYAYDLRYGELLKTFKRSWLPIICVRQGTVEE